MVYNSIMNGMNWFSKWSSDQIKQLLLDQFDSFNQTELGIKREKLRSIQQTLNSPHVVVISGLRRVGKSTLLAQVAKEIGDDQYYYLNFEDERFIDFNAENFNTLFQFLVEVFGCRKVFLIDEIQNLSGWEYFVRRFMDQGYKFIITGSNTSLLSGKLGERLTGRYIPIELFPFSFREFLQFISYEIPLLKKMTSIEEALLQKKFSEYLSQGGVPDAIKYPELPILKSLYNDVLYRDIAARYHITSTTALQELAYFLISNPSSTISYNKLKSRLKLGSVTTVTSYIQHLQNSWLMFAVNVFDFSVKRQQLAPKKIYMIDTGLANEVGFHFLPNTGKLLENIVFLEFRRLTSEIYYYSSQDGYEADLYLPEMRQLVQISQDMHDSQTRERELRSLVNSCQELHLSEGMILTEKEAGEMNVGGINIITKSIYKWLLER